VNKKLELHQSWKSVVSELPIIRQMSPICGKSAPICVICVLLQDFDAALDKNCIHGSMVQKHAQQVADKANI
jgi:hypothetical protein